MRALILILPFVLSACGEPEVKRVIMQPSPQSQAEPAKPVSCGVRFSEGASLKQIAIEAAKMADECHLDESQMKALLAAGT
jgi:hypothetical protein